MYINLPNSSDKRHIFFSVSSSSSASVIIDNVVIKSRSALDQVHFFYPRSIGENDVILEWDDKHISNVSIKVSSMSINPNEEDGDIVSEVTPSIFSYPLIGLSPNTKYYCYAKAIHPYYGQSKWGQENTFTTLASSIGVPYNVNFSGCELGKEGVPSDLYIYNTGDVFCYEDISPAIVEVHNTDSTVLRALSLNRYKEVISGKYTILEETYLFLPKFYGSILDYYIDLVATTNSANSKLLIGTTQCPNDISSFVPYQSITLGHQTNFRIYMDNCIDDRGYITLLMETSNNNELASCYIESIYVGNMTNLHDVNNIRVNNVTSKSCNISWSSINKNDVQWRVKVVEALDYKEGMNWFNITNFTVDTVVNIHSIHLNGLNPNQYYFFLINPIDTLGVEHESYEKNNYFQTLCAPFELPYTPGFTAVDSATRIFPECFNVHVSDNSSPIFVCSDNELDMTFNEGQPVYLEFPEFL